MNQAGGAGAPGLPESSSSTDAQASAAGSDGVVGSGSVPLDTPDDAASVEARQSAGGAGGQAGGAPGGSGGGPSAEDALDCADGVPGPDGARCYRLVTEGAFWQDARDACVAWGGTLAKVETPDEDTFLSELTPLSLWLGASDLALDNVFVWTDGAPIFYGNWGPQQPDRFPGPDCIEKRDDGGRQWFDQPCNNARAFVCERALAAPP